MARYFVALLANRWFDIFINLSLGVASLISAQSHTFMEIDHEIISTAIQEGLVLVTRESMCTKYWLTA